MQHSTHGLFQSIDFPWFLLWHFLQLFLQLLYFLTLLEQHSLLFVQLTLHFTQLILVYTRITLLEPRKTPIFFLRFGRNPLSKRSRLPQKPLPLQFKTTKLKSFFFIQIPSTNFLLPHTILPPKLLPVNFLWDLKTKRHHLRLWIRSTTQRRYGLAGSHGERWYRFVVEICRCAYVWGEAFLFELLVDVVALGGLKEGFGFFWGMGGLGWRFVGEGTGGTWLKHKWLSIMMVDDDR